jgi:hypothetical protein
MKKVICIALAVIAVLLVSPLPGDARGPYQRGGAWTGAGYGPRGGPYWGGQRWGPWWGARPFWGTPYVGVPYPYYAGPPVVVEQSPPVYVQPAPQPEEPYYWYYCERPKGYYPYINECPGGWMKTVPSTAPPGR